MSVKVLVIQGAGMNMRGKVDIEIFGSMTLEQLNDTIRGYATNLGVDVEFFHSNIEGEVVNALYDAHDGDMLFRDRIGKHRQRTANAAAAFPEAIDEPLCLGPPRVVEAR